MQVTATAGTNAYSSIAALASEWLRQHAGRQAGSSQSAAPGCTGDNCRTKQATHQHPPRRPRAQGQHGQTQPPPPLPPQLRWRPEALAGCRACIGRACGRGWWRYARLSRHPPPRHRPPPLGAMAPLLAAPPRRSRRGGAAPAAAGRVAGHPLCHRWVLSLRAASSAAAAAATRPRRGCRLPGTGPGTHHRRCSNQQRCRSPGPAEGGGGDGQRARVGASRQRRRWRFGQAVQRNGGGGCFARRGVQGAITHLAVTAHPPRHHDERCGALGAAPPAGASGPGRGRGWHVDCR